MCEFKRIEPKQYEPLLSLAKELTKIYKSYGIIKQDDVGQVTSHINNGSVSKVWANLEIK